MTRRTEPSVEIVDLSCGASEKSMERTREDEDLENNLFSERGLGVADSAVIILESDPLCK